jgi:hypothetical protein
MLFKQQLDKQLEQCRLRKEAEELERKLESGKILTDVKTYIQVPCEARASQPRCKRCHTPRFEVPAIFGRPDAGPAAQYCGARGYTPPAHGRAAALTALAPAPLASFREEQSAQRDRRADSGPKREREEGTDLGSSTWLVWGESPLIAGPGPLIVGRPSGAALRQALDRRRKLIKTQCLSIDFSILHLNSLAVLRQAMDRRRKELEEHNEKLRREREEEMKGLKARQVRPARRPAPAGTVRRPARHSLSALSILFIPPDLSEPSCVSFLRTLSFSWSAWLGQQEERLARDV